jgi:hypothetical protein
VFVLLAIFDGMVHKWGVGIFFIFGDSESDEGVLDIIGYRKSDGFCYFVVEMPTPRYFDPSRSIVMV